MVVVPFPSRQSCQYRYVPSTVLWTFTTAVDWQLYTLYTTLSSALDQVDAEVNRKI